MTVNASDLLKKLGSTVGTGAARSPIDRGGDAFAALLQRACAGDLQTERPVTIDRGVNLRLSPEELERVGRAADHAQAQGFAHAAVILDGKALVLDVEARRITGVVDGGKPGAFPGIEGIVTAAPIDDAIAPPDATAAQATRQELFAALRRPQIEGLIKRPME